MIKNILVSIDYELKETFCENYNEQELFKEGLIDILSYYKYSIYKAGKDILNKRIKNPKSDLDESDNKFIDNYDFNELIDNIDSLTTTFKDSTNQQQQQLYDKIIYIVIGDCIKLFKIAQINCCKNIGIKKIKLLSDSVYSCNICKTYSKFVWDVDKFDFNIIHPYCKLTILPIININEDLTFSIAEFKNCPVILTGQIKSIITLLSIQLKDFITFKTFIFKDDIKCIEVKNDNIFISNEMIDKIDIQTLIVKELLKDKLLELCDKQLWENNFNNKKNSKVIGNNCIIYNDCFVNSQCESDYIEYFKQSYINYILDPKQLLLVDINAYNQIKKLIHKEFIKG